MKQNKVKPSSPEPTKQELIHRWRIVEFQTYYRKYRGILAPCKPIISSQDIYFNSYKEAEDYYNSHCGYDSWVKSCHDTWHKAYYEIIDNHSAILRYTDSDNYRICTWSICDFYEDANNYNGGVIKN
jgi:hypothetical protein